MLPVSQLYPGPSVPLVEYLPRPPATIRELDVRRIPAGMYRAIVRCYALEAIPWEVMSVGSWLDYIAEGERQRKVATGAVFQVESHPVRRDFKAGLIIGARPGVHDLGVVWRPHMTLAEAQWNSRVGSDLDQDEFVHYQSKMLRALMRVRAMGLKTGHQPLLEKRPGYMKFPNVTRQFLKPLPGAIAMYGRRPVWILQEVDARVMLVEDRELQLHKVYVEDLEVLG